MRFPIDDCDVQRTHVRRWKDREESRVDGSGMACESREIVTAGRSSKEQPVCPKGVFAEGRSRSPAMTMP
jgi:hypothetical protein